VDWDTDQRQDSWWTLLQISGMSSPRLCEEVQEAIGARCLALDINVGSSGPPPRSGWRQP
jgi:hypothetical protein